jgi:hypothetical protein
MREGAARGIGRRLGLEAVAAPLIELATTADVDAVGVFGDLDGFERLRSRHGRRHTQHEAQEHGEYREEAARGRNPAGTHPGETVSAAHARSDHVCQSSSIKPKRTWSCHWPLMRR